MFRSFCFGVGAGAPPRKPLAESALCTAVAIVAAFVFGASSGFAQKAEREPGKPRQNPLSVYHVDTKSDRIDVLVTINKSETVKVEFPFSEALVGNSEIADVVPLTNRSIYLLGKKIGVTRL